MIATLKTDDGYIYGYIEWYNLDVLCNIKDKGEYCWVQDLWIHNDFRGNGSLKELIKKLEEHEQNQNVTIVRWKNAKHQERLSKLFHIGG